MTETPWIVARVRREVLDVLAVDVGAEVARSMEKWGVQSHGDGTSGFPHARARSNEYRALTDTHAKKGYGTWWDILLEEVYEAGAETEYAVLRAELVQVANVAALWVNDLDRREAARVALNSPRAALEGTAEIAGPVVPDACDLLYGGIHSHMPETSPPGVSACRCATFYVTGVHAIGCTRELVSA